MKRFIIASLICLAVAIGVAFFPKEYARVLNPDGRHIAIAKYHAYQAWLPVSPADAGGKEGWILIVAKDGETIGSAPVDRVSQIQDLRWTPDSVEVPLVFGIALASTASAPSP